VITDSLVDELREFIRQNYIMNSDYINVQDDTLNPIPNIKSVSSVRFNDVYKQMKQFIQESHNAETFSVILKSFMDSKNITSSELYTRANIDRRLFSKIMGERDYHPNKNTIIAFGIALKLTREEMDKMLKSAGYILNECLIHDLVIMFCLKKSIYNINDVNALLVSVGLKVLGKGE
jgi:hypothetical protein